MTKSFCNIFPDVHVLILFPQCMHLYFIMPNVRNVFLQQQNVQLSSNEWVEPHLCGVVESARGRRQRQVTKGNYFGCIPSFGHIPAYRQHVVSKFLPKHKGSWIRLWPGLATPSNSDSLMLVNGVKLTHLNTQDK